MATTTERPIRLALLTNFVAPYRVPVFQELRRLVGSLRIFASTRMEADRMWQPDWGDLDVVIQKTLTFNRVWQTERFRYPYQMHIPYDTVPRLWQYRPDVIISGEMNARSIQAVMYGQARRVPVIIWATVADHLEDSHGRKRAVVRRELFRHAARVIVNGNSGATYARRMGVPDARIVIIPQSTDLAPFQALPLQRAATGQRTLLVVGALTQLKGVDLFLSALAQLDRPVRVIIVGDGPQRAELQAVPLPDSVQVEWVGHVAYDALSACYGRAGLLVFPTHGDEWGLVVNEALAAGVPVVGSEYSQAVQDLVREGENGWRFRPDSVAEIRDVLQRALNTSDEQLARMRQNARATMKHLQPRDIALRFARVVREVHRERTQR